MKSNCKCPCCLSCLSITEWSRTGHPAVDGQLLLHSKYANCLRAAFMSVSAYPFTVFGCFFKQPNAKVLRPSLDNSSEETTAPSPTLPQQKGIGSSLVSIRKNRGADLKVKWAMWWFKNTAGKYKGQARRGGCHGGQDTLKVLSSTRDHFSNVQLA